MDGEASTIQTVSRVASMRKRLSHELSADIAQQVPKRVGEGEGHTFVHGMQGGYELDSRSTRRWYVVDGGGRIHPLRERWRSALSACSSGHGDMASAAGRLAAKKSDVVTWPTRP